MSRLIFVTLLFFSTYCCAQSDSSGVYLTSADFIKRKLTYPSACNTNKNPIKLRSLFSNQKIRVTQNGQRDKFMKSQLFGYSACNKKSFRFYHSEEYRIISTLKIYLYHTESESGTGKSAYSEEQFFFSVSLDSAILPLSVYNLKEAYPTNIKFHTLLDAAFGGDAELSTFDKYLKKYKLVIVYEESFK